jgi:hypothetical protein
MASSRKNSFRGFHAEDRARQRAIYGLDQETSPGVATLAGDDHQVAANDSAGGSEADTALAFSGTNASAICIPHWPFEGD